MLLRYLTQDHLLANHSSQKSGFIERASSSGVMQLLLRSEMKQQQQQQQLRSEGGGVKQLLQCPECNRQFPSLSSLQGHMRVHNSGIYLTF